MKTMQPLKLNCSSVFATYELDYIEQRYALGLKCNTDIAYLNQFDRFCIEHDILTPTISQDLFDAWCAKRPAEKSSTYYLRIQHLRAFAVFCHNNGLDAPSTFHPLPNPPKTFTPYIFTHDEIGRFFAAVDNETRNTDPHSPLKHLVMPLLFRMLYGCGLRVTETLLLKIADVDLEQGTLLLLDAKGGKDRLVAMSESLTALCRSYRSNTLVQNFGSEYFFPAPDRGFYDSSNIYARFRQYLFAAGIGHGGRGKGPRLHDFRHTFSVHTLNNWAKQGKDIYVCLPILSVYLGHTNGLKSTQQYLRLVPEAYMNITEPFETEFTQVFPEVHHENL
jgi:integrase